MCAGWLCCLLDLSMGGMGESHCICQWGCLDMVGNKAKHEVGIVAFGDLCLLLSVWYNGPRWSIFQIQRKG